ncbi:hypothetical protein NMB32_21720 [Stenotrophomonas sp. CD2]|nr:hypothetical protein NMB32_21720 [Stenotrophomonas sp. CD2]
MPATGDIHVVHNARLGAYVAYQLTHQNTEDGSFAILALDWVGSALPDAAAVAAMQPARFSPFRAAPAILHRWVGKRVPRDFRQVGWREPLIADRPRTYGSWPDGAEWVGQRKWDALDTDAVREFHAAMSVPQDQSVVLESDAFPVRRCTRQLDSATLNRAPSLSVFDALPLLTQLEISTPVPGLLPWLRTRPLIHTLQISGQQETDVDVRGTRLLQMTIDVTGLRSLHLNPQLDRLTLIGSIDPALIIHAEDEGRWLTLISTDPLLPDLGWRSSVSCSCGRYANSTPHASPSSSRNCNRSRSTAPPACCISCSASAICSSCIPSAAAISFRLLVRCFRHRNAGRACAGCGCTAYRPTLAPPSGRPTRARQQEAWIWTWDNCARPNGWPPTWTTRSATGTAARTSAPRRQARRRRSIARRTPKR